MDCDSKQDAMIPLLHLKSGKYRFKAKKFVPEDKAPIGMYLSANNAKLYFKIPVISKKKLLHYTTLECQNITAADLRVTNKYGSWNSLKCNLIVECLHPLVAYVPKENVAESNQQSFKIETQESCMLQASFDIHHTADFQSLLEALKLAQSNERKKLKINKNFQGHLPPRIREGLPLWVKFIPAQWYSSSIRRVLEHLIFIYTILTITWAFWQLYKNVHFVRHYLQPIIIWIETYFAILKAWIQTLDSFLVTLTDWWWKLMKPTYVLIAPLYMALSQLFTPLKNIGEIIATAITPLFQFFGIIFRQFKLLIYPIVKVGVTTKQVIMRIFVLIVNNPIVSPLWQRMSSLGIVTFLRETQLGVLDPLRAHMLLVQQTIVRSTNQIFKGLRFLFINIRSVFFFAQQERNFISEDENVNQDVEEKTKVD